MSALDSSFRNILDTVCSFPVTMVGQDFPVTHALLKLATAYEVDNLREEIIHRLGQSWPATLSQWEVREKSAVNEEGVYAPRPKLPHPMYVQCCSYIAYSPFLSRVAW